MRSFVAVVFAGWILIGSLLPGFGIGQSPRLNDLVQHYRKHQQEAPNLSFAAFLDMHYGANSDHQKHPNHSHQHLPGCEHSTSIYSPSLVRLAVPAPVHSLITSRVNFFRRADMYSFLSVFSLINPPRA